MRARWHRRGRGLGEVPNYVEPANTPDQSSPWATNYAAPSPTGTITFGPMTIKPAKGKTKKTTVKAAASSSSSKTQLKRVGTAGGILDRILPIMVDATGKQTIFGLAPALVYVAGGVLSATLVAVIIRALRGGVGRRVSNPKRAPRGAQR
jgi:hypothetical protein